MCGLDVEIHAEITICMREIVGGVIRYCDPCCENKNHNFFFRLCLLVICKNLCLRKFSAIYDTYYWLQRHGVWFIPEAVYQGGESLLFICVKGVSPVLHHLYLTIKVHS